MSCWGEDHFGQTDVPTSIGKALQVEAGAYHTCALDNEDVICWGKRYFNTGPNSKVDVLDAPKNLKNPKQLSVGAYGGCVLDDDGVHCWGINNSKSRSDVKLKDPVAVQSAGWYNCATDSEGVKCWGSQEFSNVNPPQGLGIPGQLSLNGSHACALTNGDLTCWGPNQFSNYTSWHFADEDLSGVHSRVPFADNTCGIKEGRAKCWGDIDIHLKNDIESLGDVQGFIQHPTNICVRHSDKLTCPYYDLTFETVGIPEEILPLYDYTNSCQISSGKLSCFYKNTPLYSPNLTNPRQLAGGASGLSCAIGDEGLKCWIYGADYPTSPMIVDPIDVAVTGYNYCVIDKLGASCDGPDVDGTWNPPHLNNPREIASGGGNWSPYSAISDSGVDCWGKWPNPILDNVPKGLVNPSNLMMAFEHACVDDQGQRVCWGSNSYWKLKELPQFPN